MLDKITHRIDENRSLSQLPEHSAESPLSVHALTVAYDAKPVIWEMEFDITPNTLTAVVGPNGAGKSTLLKACLDLVPRSTGIVEVFGKPFDEQRNKVAYVPQRNHIDWSFPISVLNVVLMGRYGQRPKRRRMQSHDCDIAYNALEKVGMSDFAKRQISQLSGGQQQRVFMARALAQQVDVFLMDEPFAGVDAATESAILRVLNDLKSDGASVLVVHHDLLTVGRYFDEVLLMNGRLIAFGPVDKVFTQENQQRAYGGRLTVLDDVASDLHNRVQP